MKKGIDVLLIISGVFSIIAAIGYAISAVVLFLFASPAFKDLVIRGLQEGTINSTIPGTPEEVATFVQSFFLGFAIGFMVALILSILCAVFSFKTRKDATNIGYILTLVFSALSGTIIGMVAGILGLVDNSNNKTIVQ